MEPDRQGWAFRFAGASNKAVWAIGIPRPIRLALKWPLFVLVLFAYVIAFPIRFLRYLIKPV